MVCAGGFFIYLENEQILFLHQEFLSIIDIELTLDRL